MVSSLGMVWAFRTKLSLDLKSRPKSCMGHLSNHASEHGDPAPKSWNHVVASIFLLRERERERGDEPMRKTWVFISRERERERERGED